MTLTYIHCLDLPPGVPDRWPASLCLHVSDDRVLTAAADCSTAEQVYRVLPHFSHNGPVLLHGGRVFGKDLHQGLWEHGGGCCYFRRKWVGKRNLRELPGRELPLLSQH